MGVVLRYIPRPSRLDGEPALAAYLLPVLEKDEGERQHGHGEEGQQRRCPLVTELLVHLDAEERERGWRIGRMPPRELGRGPGQQHEQSTQSGGQGQGVSS